MKEIKQKTLPKKKINIFKMLDLIKHRERQIKEQKNKNIKAIKPFHLK